MIKTIYFAHAMTDYGHDRESAAIYTICKELKGVNIINPSAPEHERACAAFKRAGKNAMDYFCALVREAEALAFMATEWGEIGPGVAKEIIEALCFDKQVFEVTPNRLLHRPTPTMIFNNRRILPISEMRARVAAMVPA